MSKTIDERVVEMRFNNKDFEQNVATTMSTLDKLKQGLKLEGVSKGFEQIGTAASKVDMSGLSGAVETVRDKFSVLEVMAITALVKISNAAIDAGKKIVTALTIDPIKSGFSEYETQINAIQTILANTEADGTTLQQVNGALAELNTYADKTIYNFTEMTRNIGTFTAAGVELDTSVSAIKGIANLAAVSGSNSQQASTAMYQLSQALASGTVKLQDWNSVVNAGMGGQVFQEALKETARVHGINIDAMVEKQGSFRETLKEGWLTSEVLTETLSKFTGDLTEGQIKSMGYTDEQAAKILKMGETANDAATKVKTLTQLIDTVQEAAQSGWTKSWELIVGDFGEAKELWTEISDVINGVIEESANARNELLSKGLSSGWKQLLAEGIGHETNYIEHIRALALEHGEEFENMIDNTSSFEEAIKQGLGEGVISSDTLKEAVFNLADEYRGLTDKQRQMQGYTKQFEEDLFALEAALKDGSVSMEEYVQKINQLSGRENLIQALRNAFEGLASIITPIKDAFRDIFPPMTGDQLYQITVKIKELTESFKISEKTSELLHRTFKGVFAVFDIGVQAATALAEAFLDLMGGADSLIDPILEITASIGDWLVALDESIKSSNIFKTTFGGIVDTIQLISDKVKEFASALVDKIDFSQFQGLSDILDSVKDRFASLFDGVENLENGISNAFLAMGKIIESSSFLKGLTKVYEGVKKFAGEVVSALTKMVSSIIDNLGGGNFVGVLDTINGIIAAILGLKLKDFLDNTAEAFEGFSGITEGIVGVLDSVRGTFEAYQTKLKADVLMKIAGAIAILTAAILILSTIDSAKLNTAMGAITLMFVELLAAMTIFSRIGGEVKGVLKASTTMLAMSTSILILATALKQLSDLNPEQIKAGVIGIAGLATIMIASTKLISNGSTTIMKGATQLVIFAAAIKLLASAAIDLAQLDFEQLKVGLIGVGTLMGTVAIFLNTTKNATGSIATATGIVILSAAIKILASAVKDFSEIGDWDEIKQGLVSVGVILAELAIFTKLTDNAKNVISTGAALVLIAASMKVFASAMQDFADIGDWDALARGLVGMAGALTAVTIAVNLMPKDMIGKGLGLIAISSALVILAKALTDMSSLSWDEVAKGMTVLGGAMLILTVGLNAMTGTLAGSAALLVASAALAILAPTMKTLGSLSWDEIVRGLTTLAGAFTILGVAGAVLTPLLPTILGLSGAFVLLGVGVLGIGAGLLAAGLGLSALAVGITALGAAAGVGATAIVASLSVIIIGIAGLIPAVAVKIGEGIIAIIETIAASATAIGEAFKTILLTFIDVVVEVIPAWVDGVLTLVREVFSALVEHTPEIVDYVFEFLIKVLEGVAKNIPELVTAAVAVLAEFFSGVIDALSAIDTETLVKAVAGVGLLSAIMLALGAVSSLIPGAMVGVAGMALVIAEIALLLAAIGALAQIPGLNWFINEGAELLKNMGNAIGSFVGGLIGGVMEGVTSSFPKMATDLSQFMTNLQPFLEGAKLIDTGALEGVKSLTEVILLLTAASVIEGITSFFTGGASLTKFGEELAKFGPVFKQYYDAVSGIDGGVVEASANAAMSLAKFAENLPNSGGLVSWFTGDNSLAKFADELSKFGPSFKQYASSVSGVDSNVVTNTTNAAKSLSELAKNLPNQGGLVSWFTGDNKMSSFGKNLVEFGKSFASYATSVGSVNISSLSGVVTEFEKLIKLATSLEKIDTSGMSNFAKNLTDLGKAGIEGFIKSFTDSTEKVKTTATDLVTAFIKAAESKKEEMSKLFETFMTESLKTLNDKQSAFQKTGTDLLAKFIEGIKSKESETKNTVTKLVTDSVTAIRNLQSQFTEAGKYLVQGFANGISANTYMATAKARAMAQQAASAAKSQLQVRSPSKVGYEIGNFFGVGFVNGIHDNIQNAYSTGSDMAKSAKNGLSEAMNSVQDKFNLGLDSNPTIRPVLDLSDIEAKSNTLNGLLNKDRSISVGSIGGKTNIVDDLKLLLNGTNRGPDPQGVNINIDKMEVRSDSDIYKIARELNKLVERENRGRGIQFA